MKYHGLLLQPMQESGASLLRAMQNESMVRLDLLVRESIQNALDAAKNGVGQEVRVDYSVRTHATDTIASLLSEGIDGPKLRRRFPKGSMLLEVRDSFTEGLTGPMTLEEVDEGAPHGNLLKLVYEIGRTRNEEGAGGSWGLGKTCYFRMGIGLVFYYSRIQLDGIYQERLVACLVENESSPDRLQIDTRTGIAWWGADGMKPIIRSSQIKDILEKMGIRRFANDETGTAIIIPFLRDDLIPSETSLEESETRPAVPSSWWNRNYESYLTVAVQRWFCARLDNPLFSTGPKLTVSVNDVFLTRKKMLPIFRAVQSLYNRGTQSQVAEDDYFVINGIDDKDLICDPIIIKSVFEPNGPAGRISGVLLSPAQLKMSAPDNNPDPFLCLYDQLQPVAPFRPIVTFMRKPGMCIRWDDSTENRAWAGGLVGSADGRYLIAVFVPEQDRKLTKALQKILGTPTLEAYLRSCERADHSQWRDIAGQNIASRIRSNTGKRLREFGSIPPRNSTVSPAIRLARNIADLLLPQRGMGSDGRSGKGSPRKKELRVGGSDRGGGATTQPVLEVVSIEYLSEGIKINWELNWGRGQGNVSRFILLAVESENGAISFSDWKESGLGEFPYGFENISITPHDIQKNIRVRFTISRNNSCVEIRTLGTSFDGGRIHGAFTIAFKTQAARTLRPLVRAVLPTSVGANL